jgi:hypothetical protein
MNKLNIITIGNNKSNFVGAFVNKEITIIKKWIEPPCLHLFSGSSKIGDTRIDISHENATHNMDVFDFLETNQDDFKTILLDPVYNKKHEKIYNTHGQIFTSFSMFANTPKTSLLWKLISKLRPEKIILKSWYYYIPRNYDFEEGYLCYPGGYRKSTILLKMSRKDLQFEDILNYTNA